MKQYRSLFPEKKMSQVFNVSKSGYYEWLNRPASKTKLRREKLRKAIHRHYNNHKGMIGSPGIAAELKDFPEWRRTNRTRVALEMKAMGLRCRTRRKFVVTTDSKHSEPIVENILARNFNVHAPNTVWVSDITYLRVNNGWAYLTVIIDLYARKVVGWSLGNTLESKWTNMALNQAIWKRKPEDGLIFHSDRGIQYASKEVRQTLENHKFIQSMSRKGDCWDNAVAESFFSTLKTRLIYHRKYERVETLKRDLFWYIEIYYNRYRKHSTNNWRTPEEKELTFYSKRKNVA